MAAEFRHRVKLSDVCEASLRDIRAQERQAETLGGCGLLLRQYAAGRGVEDFERVDSDLPRDWRQSWILETGASRTRIAQTKAFFSFAVTADWVEFSPAARLRAPMDDAPPTMPLSREVIRARLVAAEGKGQGTRGLLLMMCYSSLAIGDVATLAALAVHGDRLILRRAKRGNLVLWCLHAPVAGELARAAGLGAGR